MHVRMTVVVRVDSIDDHAPLNKSLTPDICEAARIAVKESLDHSFEERGFRQNALEDVIITPEAVMDARRTR